MIEMTETFVSWFGCVTPSGVTLPGLDPARRGGVTCPLMTAQIAVRMHPPVLLAAVVVPNLVHRAKFKVTYPIPIEVSSMVIYLAHNVIGFYCDET